MTTNPSGINPIEYNVLVLVDKVEEKTKGGLLIPDSALDRKQAFFTVGTLIAASPLAFAYERWPEGTQPPKPGERIMFTKAAGRDVTGLDGETYKILKDKDIEAVFDAEPDQMAALMSKAKEVSKRFQALDTDIRALNTEAANG